ncbi:MAG: SoxXA-binding protein [Gammaproteobacteria bacterium]|nr:SoxXA-binding protein [Gammaproteobacteria bacterium]MDH5801831.1 SoxXA-binding protein [Gammaproteobacteria bacterium]
MRKVLIVTAAFLAISISGCASTGGGTMATSSDGGGSVESLIKEAEAVIKKAQANGGAWRDSQDKFIKGAKAALSKGDTEQARKLAARAKFEGEAAYQQAMSQKNAGPWLF